MKGTIISYSLSGNNKGLAERLAEILGASHIQLQEKKARGIGGILADLWFNRQPEVSPDPATVPLADFVLFVGPVWMENPATPLRAYMAAARAKGLDYGYLSIAGGALHRNPRLEAHLAKRMGKAPSFFKQFFVSDILELGRKAGMKDTQGYKVEPADLERFAREAAAGLKTRA